jgi:hypothetical protein
MAFHIQKRKLACRTLYFVQIANKLGFKKNLTTIGG